MLSDLFNVPNVISSKCILHVLFVEVKLPHISIDIVYTRQKYTHCYTYEGVILCMSSASERRRCNVTSSLIGCAHSQNDP